MEQEEVPILKSEDQMDIEMPVVSESNDIISMPPDSQCCSVCAFSRQENTALESEQRWKSATKLSGLIAFYVIVMLVEVIGGVKANSLAVMTDAAHLLSDVAGFSISLFTVWASTWKATSYQSFGYNRIEVLGALLSVQLIWLISAILIYEAVNRILQEKREVNGALMFATAAFGFIINLAMVIWLGHDHHTHHACGGTDHHHHHHHHHHDHHHHGHEGGKPCDLAEEAETSLVPSTQEKTKILNINLQGAYLHVMSDLVQSIGVMIAGAVIWIKPHWLVVDLLCTLVFSTLALRLTLPMLRDIFGILMERTPQEINVEKLENGIKNIEGVQNVHDLHVWAITVGKLVLSCHVVAEPEVSSSEILSKVRDYCEKTYKIHHITIQVE
ncbi:Cation efflux protein [Corchorus olitorius]|uniref:Cation efflux protein n=1 Tax=Corchorus olitorius TaxID=93759 RepID=A0A1R3J8J3_9ROSI|nr:Cation efflux protein [Corchorus olitorius]